MTTAAVVFMTVSITFVVGLVSWCYFKILTDPSEE
jgi:hypothetical protein